MNTKSLYKQLKQWLAGIGFRLFIWGNETTSEEYWEQIYNQEKVHRGGTEL